MSTVQQSLSQSDRLPRPPWWLQASESAANGLRRAGILRFALRADDLIAQAEGRDGGRFQDLQFLPELERFCESFAGGDQLTSVGRRAVRYMILDALRRRLQVEQQTSERPEIEALAIERPIFVIGPPRTGTTLLQSLLALHPDCRWLRPWELEQPYPRNDAEWGGPRDKRKTRHELAVRRARQRGAAIDAIHPVDSPAECWQLLWTSFASHTVFLFFGLGSAYQRWAAAPGTPATEAYRLYRRQLQQLLRLQAGSHWVLKAPEHLLHLPALLAVFPDAAIVQLHRDPLEFLPSLCSLAYHCQYLTVRDCNARTVGSQATATMRAWIDRNLADRATLPADRIIDVRYSELAERPIATIERIYERLGRGVPAAMRTRMKEWLAERHGPERRRHRYSLEQFGLDAGAIGREFQQYQELFGLEAALGASAREAVSGA